MKQSSNNRKKIENEVVFRGANEKVSKEIDAIQKAAKSEGHLDMLHDEDLDLHFYCECYDENCRDRISMKQEKYKKLHQNSSQFIVLPGHDDPEIERIMSKTKKYMVVEKFMTPPKHVSELKLTTK